MDLHELMKILRLRWVILVVLLLVGTGAGLAIAEATPKEYTSTSTLFVTVNAAPSPQTGTLSQLSQYLLQRVVSYSKIVNSPNVLVPVIKRLGLNESPSSLAQKVTTTNPTGTVLLQIAATDGDAARAAKISTDVAKQVAVVVERLEAVRGKSPVKVTLTNAGGVPTAPSSPKPKVDIAIGILAGLILGLVAAVARQRSDNSIRSAEDLQQVTGTTPLGVVPKRGRFASDPLAPLAQPQELAEAYRTIRDRLQFTGLGVAPRRIVVTSPASGDGRTTVVCNLAVALMQTGARVCIVEADMRRPILARFAGGGARGLSDVLADLVEFDAAVRHLAGEDLDLLTAGTTPPDPGELLASDNMTQLMQKAAKLYDYVVIDVPPALPVSDAAIVARHADGAIVVTRYGSTGLGQLAQSTNLLDEAGVTVLGTVFMAAPKRTQVGYGYHSDPPANLETRPARHLHSQRQYPRTAGLDDVFGDQDGDPR